MRVQGVVIALTCLLNHAADSMADPIALHTPRSSTSHSWSFHLDEDLTALGIVGIGADARYRKWEDTFVSSTDNWSDDLTLHGQSRVAQLPLDAVDLPGYHRQFTFRPLPQLTNGPEWSFSAEDGTRHPRVANKEATSVPEPASAALLAIAVGLTSVAARWRRDD